MDATVHCRSNSHFLKFPTVSYCAERYSQLIENSKVLALTAQETESILLSHSPRFRRINSAEEIEVPQHSLPAPSRLLSSNFRIVPDE
jgi:hypothetical protein